MGDGSSQDPSIYEPYKDLACHGFQFDSIMTVVLIQMVLGRKMYQRIMVYTTENIPIECKVFIAF
jgi:hypothetical protein